jgi:hypothetical protein
MNPMQQALMNSRSSNPAPAGAPPVPGTPGAPGAGGPPPEIQAMASDIQDIKASLAKLVEAISGQYQGKDPDAEPVEGEDDDKEEGSAKTFK